MDHNAHSLTSLIGSRICHDLINPIGAITNGLELLGKAPSEPGPELALIEDSVDHATARIRFFRIAFGIAGTERLGTREVSEILSDVEKAGRVRIQWQVSQDMPRSEVRLAFLALQCMETALAFGGDVNISAEDGTWRVTGSGARMQIDETLWQDLTRDEESARITPALVQFALLPGAVHEAGRRLTVDVGQTEIVITF